MKALGNRIIVKDIEVSKENHSTTSGLIIKQEGVSELISGTVEWVGNVHDFKVNNIVFYSPTTGSRFIYKGERYRSIQNPSESVIFIEE